MSNNQRWQKQEKQQLINMYAGGKSYEDIGQALNRSPNAIKLRLESIIYDNLVKGKTPDMIAGTLKKDKDVVKQLYYSHKSFREARKQPVVDIKFPDRDPSHLHSISQPLMRPSIQPSIQSSIQPSIKPSIQPSIQPARNMVNTQFGGNNIRFPGQIGSSQYQGLGSLESENKVLEEIIKNYKMRRVVKKLYTNGKLDDTSMSLCEKMIKGPK